MAITRKVQNGIVEIIQDLFALNDEISWNDISANVALNYEIKNWLDVRGVMQGLINEGYMKRVNDVHSEYYTLVK